MSFMKINAALALLLMVAGCGGGASSDAGTPLLTNPGSGGAPTVASLTMAVTLLDASGAATNAIVAGQPVRAQALLTKNGQVVAGELVQFTVDKPDLVKIDPVSGSQLSEPNGLSHVTVSSLGASEGAGRVIATATVGGVTATSAANFYASGSGGSPPATLALGPVALGSVAVSAYGTTSVEVSVLQNGLPYTSPVTVNFSSSCAAGKATITSSATTLPSGRAIATFVDNGCAQTADAAVTITASIGTDTKSSVMTVRAPTTGSLRVLAVVPVDKSITLRGQGGNGRQENATVTFKLVDVAGNGVADADVCFDVTTYIGGLNLDGFSPTKLPSLPGSTAVCGSDALSIVRYVKRTNTDGTVSVQINSGTVPTPVRVRARSLYPALASVPLETFSDTLSISTGLPLQRSFSLSVDKANIDGGNFDGEIAKLTIRLADQFSNPVPDGTVVNFIASGGAVCTADNGSCKTVNGACSCDFVSQARRPYDNRVVVTAYAVGLEDFDDRNGDNIYNLGEPFVDLGDAFVDANKDGVANSSTINGDTDILVPYQQNTVFRAAGDGVRGTAHIRASTVIYLSQASTGGQPTAVVQAESLSQEHGLLAASLSGYFLQLAPVCPDGVPLPQANMAMVLEDGIGNPMAAATSLIAVDPSDSIAPASFRPAVVLAIGARPPSPGIDAPAGIGNTPKALPWFSALAANGNVVTPHTVTVRGVKDKCAGNATFALEVASPRGGKAAAKILVAGEPRFPAAPAPERFGFDVRYRDPVNFNLGMSGQIATFNSASWAGQAAPANLAPDAAVSYVIDWGDNKSSAGAGPLIAAAHRTHSYANNFLNQPVSVQVTITTAAGFAYTSSKILTVK